MALGIERRNIPHDDTDRDEFVRHQSRLGPFFLISASALFSLRLLRMSFWWGKRLRQGRAHYEVMNLNRPVRFSEPTPVKWSSNWTGRAGQAGSTGFSGFIVAFSVSGRNWEKAIRLPANGKLFGCCLGTRKLFFFPIVGDVANLNNISCWTLPSEAAPVK